MKLEQLNRDGVLILRPEGRLDSNSSPELERALTEGLAAGTTRLVFDFAKLDLITSAGLRVVLLAGKMLRPVHGKVVLAGLGDVVKEAFKMSGFLYLFDVAETVEDGIAKCADQPRQET